MKIGNVSFGARIDNNTMNFLIKAREKGLNTEKLETLMKQIDGEIFSSVDYDNNLDFMYRGGNNIDVKFKKVLPGQKESASYITNQKTINLITKELSKIKKSDGNKNNEKLNFPPLYKRDHKAELLEIFGIPNKSIYNNAVIEQDY